ncbi:MAG: hypothetical protein NVSMB38_23670 [Ktedonobacteraceae bacterium]
MDHTNWQRTRDILISTICIGIILWAAWSIAGRFVDIIIILLLSMAVAFLLTPLVNFLTKYQVPRLVASIVVFLLVIAALSGLSSALILSLIRQIQAFSNTIVNSLQNIPNLEQIKIVLQKQAGIPPSTVDLAITQVRDQAVSYAQTAALNAVNIVFVITGTLLNVFLIGVISFYFLLDGKRIRDSIISIVPQRQMSHTLVFEDALNRVVGNYIRGQLTLAAIVGLLAGFVCVVTGLGQFAIIIGVLAFLFETIPMVGPALASVPALVISLLLPDPLPRTLWVAIAFVIIQLLESNILGPRIVGHAVGLHPVASILALLVFAQLFGPFGALIATPIVAAIWVVIASIYRSARGETADEMLAKKRAPWTIQRPTMPSFRGRRRSGMSDSGGSVGSSALRPSADGSGNVHGTAKTHMGDTVQMEITQDDHVEVGREDGDGKRVVSIERSTERS